MSAPSSRGFCSTGEAKVLSTTSRQSLASAMPAIVSISDILSVGLVGVSSQMILVLSVTAANTVAGGVGRPPLWRYANGGQTVAPRARYGFGGSGAAVVRGPVGR